MNDAMTSDWHPGLPPAPHKFSQPGALVSARERPLVVQKFGGTSMGSTERIRNAARRALKTQQAGNDVVVIVSAMSGETNRLLALAKEVGGERADDREVDAIASTGEQVAAGLMAIAIQAEGGDSRSFLGHQVKVNTDNAFTKARIRSIDGARIHEELAAGRIVVIAGYQGVDGDGNITTLGRGGSDTSAVAIAAAIHADVCEIYTDVDGVYTTDPNVCPTARKVARISFEEMLELASLGAKVLQIRSVEVAMKFGMPIHVRSSFVETEGTWVVAEDALEGEVVAGVACDKNEVRIMLVSVDDRPGIVAEVFGLLADQNIGVDMIIQNAPLKPGADGLAKTDLTFTVSRNDLPRVKALYGQLQLKSGAVEVRADEGIAKVSIVGLGMRSHAGVAATMFRILAKEGINIQAITTSEIKVSCVVDAKYAELAVRALHDGFNLGSGNQGKPDAV